MNRPTTAPKGAAAVPFTDTDAGRLFAGLVGPVELIPDPNGGPRFVRNPDAIKWHEDAPLRESHPDEVRRRRASGYRVGYRLALGCTSTRSGFDAGDRDGREAEARHRAAARGGRTV